MTHSKLASRTQWTSDGSSRDGAKVRKFIVHHAATGSLAAILELFRPGGRVVSANYAMGPDGELVATVEEQYRAWTSASYVDDREAITIEVANSATGDASGWPVSDASFDKLARLIADVATRYGFPINDDTVLTHQELYRRFGRSYATACPGDLQRRKGELIALARKYQGAPASGGGGSKPAPAKPKPKPASVKPTKAPAFPLPKGYYFGPESGPVQSVSGYHPLPPKRTSDVQKDLWRWQQRMEDRGWRFPKYGSDGMYGDETRAVAIAFQREKGLAVDGLIGPATWAAAWTEPVT